MDTSAPAELYHALELPGLSAEPIPLTLRLIDRGRFVMGERGLYPDEQPTHEVSIDEAFYLGLYPVTQAQFAAWTRTQAYRAWFGQHRQRIGETSPHGKVEPHTNHFADRQDHPAEQVTWWEAMGYAEWLNATGGIPEGWQASLPHEAQWEYACRAGTRSRYWSGDSEQALAAVGWYGGNAQGQTHPVGALDRPNPWGLHDMHGNVTEWCLDYYDYSRYRRRVPGTPWQAVLTADACEPQGALPVHQALAEQMGRYAQGHAAVTAEDRAALQWLKDLAEGIVNGGDTSWQVVLDASASALRKGEEARWPDQDTAQELRQIFQGWVDSRSGQQAARVLRGGSWGVTAVICRAADRIGYLPGNRNWRDGFRLALVPGPQAGPPGGTPGG